MDNRLRVEAVLFASGRYLSEDKIAELAGISKKDVKSSIEDLKTHYKDIQSALKVFHEHDSYKLNVKEEYNDIARNIVNEAELTPATMQTLAFIAFKTPVLQSDIIDARGASAYDHIKILEDKGFVVREKFGRSFKLRIGDNFYEYFDIEKDSNISEVFGNVKHPEHLGELQVIDVKDDSELENEFDEKIAERMKKLEESHEENNAREIFMKDFDERLEQSKSRISEVSSDIDLPDPSMDNDRTKAIFESHESEKYDFSASSKPKDNDDVDIADISQNSVEDVSEDSAPVENSSSSDSPQDFVAKINEDIDKISKQD